jgi:hypothetical protein
MSSKIFKEIGLIDCTCGKQIPDEEIEEHENDRVNPHVTCRSCGREIDIDITPYTSSEPHNIYIPTPFYREIGKRLNKKNESYSD